MGASELLLLPVRLVWLLAGLLVPGAALLRALRLPFTLAGSFVASAAVLFTGTVLCAIFHLSITLLTLSAVLVLSTALSVAWSAWHPPSRDSAPAPEDTSSFAAFASLGWWTPLYAAFWLIVLWRLATQPLSGPDVTFRWSWLAEQMVHLRSLDFYPPRTAADYSAYPWPESLPPGIASLHAWSYLCGGSVRALWTSPVVLLQFLALHEFIWRIAFSWGGEAAARRAVLLAAATPLLTWASVIGQETALTSISVCALLFGILRLARTHERPWLAFSALAAVVGAGTREYGLAFPILGVGLLALLRAPRRALLIFSAIAFPLSVLWPLRTWVLTGNPFFSLNVTGLFATNPVFATWSAHFHTAARHVLFTLDGWQQLARYAVLFAPAALFGVGALVLHSYRGLREARWCAACVVTCAVLWLVSVGFTAGGLFYSLRVLSPALALAAAFGGYAILATTTPLRRAADILLAVALLAALPQTLTLPQNATRTAPRDWPGAAYQFTQLSAENSAQLAAALRPLPGNARILTDFAGLPAVLADTGITTVPYWSPEIAWLFDPATPPTDVLPRWRAARLRYVVTSPSPAFLEFLQRHARWSSPPFALNPVWQSDAFIILEVITEPPAAH